jgi:hypothetical protein
VRGGHDAALERERGLGEVEGHDGAGFVHELDVVDVFGEARADVGFAIFGRLELRPGRDVGSYLCGRGVRLYSFYTI